MNTRNLLRRALPAVAGLMLVVGACAPQAASAHDIEGLLKAVEGKQIVIERNDGSTILVRISDDRPIAELNDLVGHEVKATVNTSRGELRSLVRIDRSDPSGDNRGPGRGDDSLQANDNRGPGRGDDDLELNDDHRGQGRGEAEVRGPEAEARGREFELRGAEDDVRGAEVEIRGPEFEMRGPELEVRGHEAELRGPEPELRGAEAEVAEDLHFSGTIESMGPSAFVLGGKTFKVDAATMLDNGLAVGVPARVEFITLPDGSMLAAEIETDAPDDVVVAPLGGQTPAPQPGQAMPEVGENFHFSGTIESMGPSAFVLGGKTFKVDAATMLDNGLAVGVLARVEFITLLDGSVLANEIETDAPDEVVVAPAAGQAPAPQLGQPTQPAQATAQDFHFSGAIQSMGAGAWVIGGRSFTVNGSTVLDTGLAVGVMVQVDFVVQPDGSALATQIETAVSGKNK